MRTMDFANSTATSAIVVWARGDTEWLITNAFTSYPPVRESLRKNARWYDCFRTLPDVKHLRGRLLCPRIWRRVWPRKDLRYLRRRWLYQLRVLIRTGG